MWLRRFGLQVVIAERRSASARAEGAFLGVAPNGMNVLDALGIADEVARRGVPCTSFQFRNAADRPIGFIPREKDRERFGWMLTMIRRGELHELLLDEAVRRGVELRRGARLTRIDRSNPDEVVAHFEDGSTVVGDLLFGCDGLRSTVRELVFPDAPQPAFSGLWDCGGFVSGVRVPVNPGVNAMVFGRKAFFGAFVTPSGELWWFHNGPPGASTDLPREQLRERLLELHRDDAPWIGEAIRATPELLGPWPLFELNSLPRWSDGRVCLIGDAAHAMSPSAGQGASMAMEDALVLARCLRDLDEPAAAFEAFEKLRRPRVEEISRQARRNGSGKAVENRLALAFRDLLLPMFLRLGAKAQDRCYAHRTEWQAQVA